MPQPDDVRDELADILGQLVGCASEDVVDSAELKQLGVDSLGIVEMADELGRRFDIYISDDVVNAMCTVGDAVTAVVQHDGARPPRSSTYDAAPPERPPTYRLTAFSVLDGQPRVLHRPSALSARRG